MKLNPEFFSIVEFKFELLITNVVDSVNNGYIVGTVQVERENNIFPCHKT